MSSIQNQYRDVPYAYESEAQQVDIFVPEGKGPFPAVLLIHGGGFKSGDKKAEYGLATQLVAKDYVAVCVNYRLSGEAVFPAAVHDVKSAIRFIKGNAKKYAVNANKIATWGSSAGGNLSAMMGTSSGDDFLDGKVGQFQNQSTQIQACVDWFGPIDFSKMIEEAEKLGFRDGFDVAIESKYLGVAITDPKNADLVQRANPTRYLDQTDPPFYVQVGSEDPLIPYLQSQNFAKALETIVGEEKVHFDLIQGAKHGGSEFSDEENVTKIISFLNKYLK
ncbi:MAG: alpha/beta hydrolase [Bacteroidota bacterium]